MHFSRVSSGKYRSDLMFAEIPCHFSKSSYFKCQKEIHFCVCFFLNHHVKNIIVLQSSKFPLSYEQFCLSIKLHLGTFIDFKITKIFEGYS